MHQNSLSLFQGYAASPKIKNGVLIHLPHCRSVGALDVVCINLQLWLGIRRGLISQQEVLFVCFASVFCASWRTWIRP